MRKTKKLAVTAMIMAIICSNVFSAYAKAPADGKTDAAEFSGKYNLTSEWNSWKTEWETVKNDWTQVSLTPGSNEKEMNFAWYSKTKDVVLKVSKNKDMSDAKTFNITGTAIVKDADDTQYYSCKETVKDLTAGTYYYQIDGRDVTEFKVQDTGKGFSFIFVGDPQIGSSNELKGQDTAEFYQAQSDAVMSDAFNWNYTLNQAMKKSGNASFVLSSGDQIQTTKKKAPNKSATNSEIEYAGYLSPSILKSLPVATTVGNHDADNANYTYHFNTPNNSELGTNGVVGGDYWFTYGDALFMMLNTQDTNVAEHKTFIEEAVKANPDCKWRIVTLHQDIYGSAEHSNEPEITSLRYQLIPYFEANDVDVVLTGHDHAYTRSKMLKGGASTYEYTDDEFDEQLDKDIDAGKDTSTRFTAFGNIKADTTDAAEIKYLEYLKAVMDESAIETNETKKVTNPEGILYMTASSSSGSKYYDLTSRMQTYVANRWQEDVPTYSVIDITNDSFTINTYRTDTNEKIDDEFTIVKKENTDSTDNEDETDNNVNDKDVSDKDSDNKESAGGKAPETGDGTNVILFAGLAVCMAGAIWATCAKSRKETE